MTTIKEDRMGFGFFLKYFKVTIMFKFISKSLTWIHLFYTNSNIAIQHQKTIIFILTHKQLQKYASSSIRIAFPAEYVEGSLLGLVP